MPDDPKSYSPIATTLIGVTVLTFTSLALNACTGPGVTPSPAPSPMPTATTTTAAPSTPPRSPRPSPTVPERTTPATVESSEWTKRANVICSDAIADYQAAKQAMGRTQDPEALQLAASVATSQAETRIRALGQPPSASAAALLRAVEAYAAAERALTIAYDKGRFDTSAEQQALNAAGARLEAVSTSATACAAWVDEL